MSEASESASKNLGIFSTLQSATEVRYFLLAATFVLLIDNVFIGLAQPSLIELTINQELMAKSNLAIKVILIFVGFSFLASLILPIFTAITHDFYLQTAHRFLIFFGDAFKRLFNKRECSVNKREFNHVFLGELKDEAHKTREKYYLDLYDKHELRQIKKWQEARECQLFSTFCLGVLCWNYALSTSKNNAISVVFATYFGSPDYVWFAVVGLLCLAVGRYFLNHKSEQIYCPSLYTKLEKHRLAH